jgi:hypothetical protein
MKYRILIILLVAAFASSPFVANEVKGAEPIKLGAIFPLADITGDQGAKAMKL